MTTLQILFIVSTVLLGLSIYIGLKLLKTKGILKKYKTRYDPIINLDEAIEVLKTQKKRLIEKTGILKEANESLSKENNLFEENIEMISFGFYTPKYDFAESAGYKEKLDEIRNQQKKLIKEEKALVCHAEITVSGSKSAGKKMTQKNIKIGLVAFNVQCDNTILKVKFNNMEASEKRLDKIRVNVDKLMESNHIEITNQFFDLKLKELDLAYEFEKKKEEEKEEQRQIREQMREEAKVTKEIEKAKAEAEKEENMYKKALQKAKAEMENKTEEEKSKMEKEIEELNRKLQEVQEKKERAKSQAELTKQGYIYIISNIGSFGENVFKIGMTRRLEPMDRVKELGDASVPFTFDVHGMIFSENAPEMEKKMHNHFNEKRLNRVNFRKEFFEVTLDEIQKECDGLGLKFELTKLAEAEEYRETLAIIEEGLKKNEPPKALEGIDLEKEKDVEEEDVLAGLGQKHDKAS